VEIVYCSKCRRQIPPGGMFEGRYYLVRDEPVCMDCAEGMSESELTASTILEVPTQARERKRPTTKLAAHARESDREEPPPEVLDTRTGPRGGKPGLVMLMVLLVVVAAIALAVIFLRGGPAELPAPKPPAPIPQTEGSGPAQVLPEADGFFRRAARSTAKGQHAFVNRKGGEEYCLRFDLSGVSGPVKKAELVLHVVWHDRKAGFKPQLTALESNNWSCEGVRWDDRPMRGEEITRIEIAVGSVEVDVSGAVSAALRSGGKLSLRVHGAATLPDSKGRVKIATLKNKDPKLRPRLKLTY
jgi:hypothetical protein